MINFEEKINTRLPPDMLFTYVGTNCYGLVFKGNREYLRIYASGLFEVHGTEQVDQVVEDAWDIYNNSISIRGGSTNLCPGQFTHVEQSNKGGGVKHDQDKLRYDLLPPEMLEETAKILTEGANKYGERNWEEGMDWSRPFGALQRHVWAWWNGEDTDPETGESHLSHALCCLAFLSAFEKRGIGTDNRPVSRGQSE